jgi:Isocitrate/isopropylmalate dehydrogenase
MKRFKDGFCVVVRDNDKKLFFVSNKIYSDESYIRRVVEAQQQGRKVICSSDESERREIIRKYMKQYPDFTFTEEHLV